MIRELAAAIAGINAQRLKHQGDIVKALIEERYAREALDKEQRERTSPSRENLARREADRQQRQEARQRAETAKQEALDKERELEHLASHHISVPRAVSTKNVEMTNRSSLAELGRMRLLKRRKGTTNKSGWELTDLGRRALELYGIQPKE